jgi:hypothetical protein
MRTFNTTAVCIPSKHYMVDLTSRLEQIKTMIDAGQYFVVNRARQYGKTTLFAALYRFLKDKYTVVSLDFQAISGASFETEGAFISSFSRILLRRSGDSLPDTIQVRLRKLMEKERPVLDELFAILSDWCGISDKPVVLLIDEVDSATNNQVFLDFLAQLRLGYIDREFSPAFQSVILAGVTDIKNLKHKLRPDEASKFNSPWNIASDFRVKMSFDTADIAGMLNEYEADHHTGMDVNAVAQAIEDFTSGYPFLVSRICQLIDTNLIGSPRFETPALAWTPEGVSETERRILLERNTLFESLMGKVQGSEELSGMLKHILFSGDDIPFNPYNIAMADGEMYGFLTNDNGITRVTNRIFESVLYDYFLNSNESRKDDMYLFASRSKNQFIERNHLDMDKVLERFVASFNDIYGDHYEEFNEEEGRRRFLLYVRPIINGTGNYYIEARTRNNERMDVVIDYLGERFVVELKIWHGNAYNERGEDQLAAYLDYYHIDKGYMLSYNFNQKKTVGVHTVPVGEKTLVEAVV